MYNARAASVLCGLHCDDGDYSSSGDRYLFIGACIPREIRRRVVVVVVVARISVSIERAELSLSLSSSLPLSLVSLPREIEHSAREVMAISSPSHFAQKQSINSETTNPEVSSVTSPIQPIP